LPLERKLKFPEKKSVYFQPHIKHVALTVYYFRKVTIIVVVVVVNLMMIVAA